jgi:integrase
MFNRDGQRKYLTRVEMDSFLKKAKERNIDVGIFCEIIASTGCRITEALQLTKKNVDFQEGVLIVRSLKKRGRRIFRAIPLPPTLLRRLKSWISKTWADDTRMFPWSRMTGYRRVCEVMEEAGIRGAYATPKGLRHAFGINAIQAGVPLNLVQRWLGHADIKTTAIYTSAIGDEERIIAQRMWRKPRDRNAAGVGQDVVGDAIFDEAGVGAETMPVAISSLLKATAKQVFFTPSTELSCALRHFWLECNRYYRL